MAELAKILKIHGPEYLDNEGHGFHNEENQFDFYGAMGGIFQKAPQ
jgi:hypothetical protein